MGWVQHGEIWENDGEHGDDQVGNAASIRFINPELPGRRVTVYAYAQAPEIVAGSCDHKPVKLESLGSNVARFAPMPPEHVACSWDLTSLGIQSEFWFEFDENATGDADDWDPTFSAIKYEPVDSRPYKSNAQGVEDATKDALFWIRNYAPSHLAWSGRAF
jgi:hypothetical protein